MKVKELAKSNEFKLWKNGLVAIGVVLVAIGLRIVVAVIIA